MPAFGRLIEHDPRSRMFAAARASTQRSVLHGHSAPVLDQGESNSCTGHALAQCLNTDFFAKSRQNFLDSRIAFDLYSLATRLDVFPGSYPPDDTGSSGLSVCKAGVRRGYLRGYGHAFGFNNFCRVIQTQPVLIGTSWYSGMSKPDRNGLVVPTGEYEGGHEYLCLGIDYERKLLTFLNSWGPSWGKNGRFFMTFDVFSKLLADRGDVAVPAAIRR